VAQSSPARFGGSVTPSSAVYVCRACSQANRILKSTVTIVTIIALFIFDLIHCGTGAQIAHYMNINTFIFFYNLRKASKPMLIEKYAINSIIFYNTADGTTISP
jgi:hypothetical protein